MTLDTTRAFIPLGIAILIMSDTRTLETDTSGQTLAKRVEAAGHRLVSRKIVTDDVDAIQSAVKTLLADESVQTIITSGGTGLTGRDVTPEAITPLFEKTIDGFSVIFHQVSFASIGLSTLQSRAVAGLAQGTFIFCLPGSNGAVKDGWDKVISHQLDNRYRPCNLVEMLPRLGET